MSTSVTPELDPKTTVRLPIAAIGGLFAEEKCLSGTTADAMIPTGDRNIDEPRTSGGHRLIFSVDPSKSHATRQA